MTNRQTEVLEYIREAKVNNGTAPTYREIAGFFGFKSTRAAVDHIRALEKKGVLRIHSGRARGIELLTSEEEEADGIISVPIKGDLPAGCPEGQTEYPWGNIVVDAQILGGKPGKKFFALRVHGDSMEGRGIYDGDWVIAEADAPYREGNVVVALIDGENTLKTLARNKGNFFLKAESPGHPDWRPVGELLIQGIARAVLRRL